MYRSNPLHIVLNSFSPIFSTDFDPELDKQNFGDKWIFACMTVCKYTVEFYSWRYF